MLKPDPIRGSLCALIPLVLATAGLQAQQPSKEYIRLGGRVIAIENATTGCAYVLSPTAATAAAAGTTATVGVSCGSTCSWTATSNVAWVTITSGSSGTGDGTVSYSVAANTGTSRTGTLTIGGQTFTVTQDAGPCSYTISPTSRSHTSSSATGAVSVTCGTTCTWTATSNDIWITITAGASGTGNGTVSYSVVANTGSPRTGTLTIAGQTFTVTQAGAGSCTYDLLQTSYSIPASGTPSGADAVLCEPECSWTATSNVAWARILPGSESGSGISQVFFAVDANTGGARTGTLTIAGQTVTIIQSAQSVDIVLSGITLMSGVQSYSATNSITAQTVTIGSSAIVTFTAGGWIRLQPGFRATAGTAATTFRAHIQ